MCGGGGGDDYSEELREQEAARKQKLQQGLRELEQVFAPYYGESVQYTGPLAGEGGDPLSQQQFQSQIEQIMAKAKAAEQADRGNLLGGDPGLEHTQLGSPGVTAPEQLQQQLAALGLTKEQADVLASGGDFDYGGAYSDLRYGDEYYDTQETGDPAWASVRQNYMDFANPQLQQQYESGAEDLTYALARGGQLTGTVGADRWSDLNQDLALRRQDVAGQAEDYASGRRQEILDLEQQYQNMLRSSSDPSLEGTNIEGQLTALSTPPAFQSLGPLFQNTTAGLAAGYGGQQAYGTNQAVNQIVSGGGRYSRDPNRGSGRVVR